MLDAYRQVLAVPGARAFTLAGLLLRLPLAMYPVGLVLLAAVGTGDYARGGLLTAAYIVAGAVGGPLLSSIADRRGQRAVLLPAALTHAAAVATLVSMAGIRAPLALQVAVAGVVGVTFVPVGALVRARWVHALDGGRGELGTALSLEATLDEVTFVLGPLVAAALATGLHPAAPFALTSTLVVVGAASLHLLRSTVPPVHERRSRRSQPLPPVTAAVVLIAVAAGVMLVSVDLAAIAFVGQSGQERWTGAVLACFALGSGVAGFAYGLRTWRSPVERRLAPVGVLFALLPVLLLLADDVVVLAAVLFVVGTGTAPLLTTIFGVLERITPPARLTEGFGWVMTGLSLGAGAAAPVVGAVADRAGARTALLIPLGASLLAGAVAVVTSRRLIGRTAAAELEPTPRNV